MGMRTTLATAGGRLLGIPTSPILVELNASNIQPIYDAGPSWIAAYGVAGLAFTSADQSSAKANVTDAPASGSRLVITDLVISANTAMSVSLYEEGFVSPILVLYIPANSIVPLQHFRSKFRLSTTDTHLQVKTSVAGNISVTAFYYSESAVPIPTFTYYIDSTIGNDSNFGNAPSASWASTAPADAITLADGQTIGMKYQGVWYLYRKNGMLMSEMDLPMDVITNRLDNF